MKYETGESLSYSSLSDAYDRLVHFARRFGEPHVTLAMHAAVPLGLTPELVHFLRIYFAKAAPQIAEADLLLSPLCREVGGGAYEMYPEVRDLLLAELQEDEAFGVARINRVAEFLLVFATRQLRTERHPESRNFLVAQQWAAFAQREPGVAAKELAEALQRRLYAQNPAGSLRLAQLARSLNAPLMGQDNVLLYAAGVESLALGDAARAQEVFAAFGSSQQAPRVQSLPMPALSELAQLWPTAKGEPDTATTATPLEQPANFTEMLNGVPLEMIYVPGGQFMMGSPEGQGEERERPQHLVTLPGFFIGKYQVTQSQWQAVMGQTPSGFKGEQLPIERVSWEEAKVFCTKLKIQTSREYRLPSEAEWEYACRAGTTGDFAGDPLQMSWSYENSDDQTHPVGEKSPNAFGLYDMHGNVWEWCEDVWHPNYKGAPGDGSARVNGGDAGRRILRGGSWFDVCSITRSVVRSFDDPSVRSFNFGFRVVVSPSSSS